TADTVTYMNYATPAITTSQENKSGVWDANYKGVWHLPNGSTLTAADSTANSNNGTITNATASAGQIDGAASFANNGRIALGANLNNVLTGRTYEAWVKATCFPNA